MPTYNRRAFVPQAIQYFLRQDYANRELIIIDDGSDEIGDLLPRDERIQYHRLGHKLTLGAKLNLACAQARGEIIVNWDDDDWYAPRRISYQVAALLKTGTELCGINDLFYYDLVSGRAYRYIWPSNQQPWLAGSSLCYRRELWATNRYAEIDVGMDAYFVWGVPPHKLMVLPDSSFAVHLIHTQNGSPKHVEGAYWHPHEVEQIRALLGDDWAYYRNDHHAPEAAATCTLAVASAPEQNPTPAPVRNIYACLVHESRECIVDLVRNLKYQDPDSVILLYNGGPDKQLLSGPFPFEHYGAIVHPAPRTQNWGWLHSFALDSMQFALEQFTFDTLTIVDSDQLAVRSGYSKYLGGFLAKQSGVGMLGNAPEPQHANTPIAPAAQAWREVELWRPFLRRFPAGESKFVHWTFWPSTVFTVDAASELTRLFATDQQLQELMQRTQIWATEEIILPTLVALLGYDIKANPCNYDLVRYREHFTLPRLEAAFPRPDIFWIHPVPRKYDDPLRNRIRTQFNQYEGALSLPTQSPLFEPVAKPDLLLTKPILAQMDATEGWLDEAEAELLLNVTAQALNLLPQPHTIVEVGSYCGRATIVLASVARALSTTARVYAFDLHDGKVGALDQGIITYPPTLERFRRNLERAGVSQQVEILQMRPREVPWAKEISLLLIDGLHDYMHVAEDFFHFERWVVVGGFIAFHDYAPYFPGVQTFVNEILHSGQYSKVHCERSLMVVQKLAVARRFDHLPTASHVGRKTPGQTA
jgi:hypothetical protein